MTADLTQTSLGTADAAPAVGEEVTHTARVSADPPGGGAAAGVVTLSDTSSAGTVSLRGTGATVDPASDTATCDETRTQAESHVVAAACASPSGDCQTSTSGSVTETVSPDGTATTLSTTGSPAGVGEEVMYTASVPVNGPGTATPTGTVAFADDTTPIAGRASSARPSPPSPACTGPGAKRRTAPPTATRPPPGDLARRWEPPGLSVAGQGVVLTATVGAGAPAAGTPPMR